ncbi:tetraacyldisaccharide 4'-kinase [Christiangramia aquimixticola]|uniref:tetraacyldisaccharide 4'-kinase n=1 Tax=Christiangramia aquimixticola TaxID=1697558 RepID=UPI003AA8A8A3
MPNLRKLLYPFSVLYKGLTDLRNIGYDYGYFEVARYDFPVIAVGNLNTGGTGKSPMIEYLVGLLIEEHKVATLSRGYKRESKGFQLIGSDDNAAKSGDEPLQFKNKYPELLVAVDADRRNGIAKLRNEQAEVILLDDAFQHRKVEAGYYILLTSYGDLYSQDLVLPAGNLRESRKGAERADVIVVTKCPPEITSVEMEKIREKLKANDKQKVFFSKIEYSNKIYGKYDIKNLNDMKQENYAIVTGIANPAPFIDHLKKAGLELPHLKFPDHHIFTENELSQLDKYEGILTTEKDFMRLKDSRLKGKLYYLPIKTEIIDNAEQFDSAIKDYVNKNEV